MAVYQTYLIIGGDRVGFGDTVTPPPPGSAPFTGSGRLTATWSGGATPTVSTIFGMNNNPGIEPKMAKMNGRWPCSRLYQGDYIAAGQTFASTPLNLTNCPERRVSWSFKQGAGSFDAAGLAAGNGNARFRDWLRSIPNNWTVYITYYHEVNDDIREGRITAVDYKGAYGQFYSVLLAERPALQARGVTAKLAANFMAYNLTLTAYFQDAWVPSHSQMDCLTFDIYGNPGNFTPAGTNTYGSSGPAVESHFTADKGYNSVYPLVPARWRDMMAIINRLGWKDSWGVLELNTPPRNWDGPKNPDYNGASLKQFDWYFGKVGGTESGRSRWLKDAVDYMMTGAGIGASPPEIMLYWEHPEGVNWNQKFYTDNMWNVVNPRIASTPDGSP